MDDTTAKDIENVVFLPEDQKLCERLLDSAQQDGTGNKTIPEIAVSLCRHFIGTSYQPHTLEHEGAEALVVNLRAFDCVTFVESVVALAFCIRDGKSAFGDYLSVLQKIRYRKGRICGYPSRLHYFTEWLRDNGEMGFLFDMTPRTGGTPTLKRLDLLTSHRKDHPPLCDETAFQEMLKIEADCSRQTFHTITRDKWRLIERDIHDGDIIAITSDMEGIDVIHTGFTMRVGGDVRLLHASSEACEVVLASQTLNSYLHENKSRTGVIVARLIDG